MVFNVTRKVKCENLCTRCGHIIRIYYVLKFNSVLSLHNVHLLILSIYALQEDKIPTEIITRLITQNIAFLSFLVLFRQELYYEDKFVLKTSMSKNL